MKTVYYVPSVSNLNYMIASPFASDVFVTYVPVDNFVLFGLYASAI